MIQTMFTILFVISLALLIMLVALFKKNISVYYILLYAGFMISNLGYMQLHSAVDINTALYASQIVYIGGSFTPFFSFMCVADLCKVKIPKWFDFLCIALGVVIFCCVSSIGTYDIYYKSVELVQENGWSYLAKEYGPLHIIYPAYLLSMSLLALAIIINSFRRRKSISYFTSTMLTVLMTATVITYILERVFKSKVEFLPLAFVLLEAGILVLLNRISLYDVSGIFGDTMTESMDYGYVMCSAAGRFTGADMAARMWFGELNELNIDAKIDPKVSEFFAQLYRWIDGDRTPSVKFERGGTIIEASHITINRMTGKVHVINLRNDTENQRYLRLVQDFGDRLEREVKAKTAQLKEIQSDIITSMASIVENRDNNTGGHIKRTSDVMAIFVPHLMETGRFNLTEETADCIVKAASLHDFGKIAIPDMILNKPGKFTDEEYEQMKKHAEKGAVIVARILQNSDDPHFKQIAVNVAHYHHEKWNGGGYPAHLSGTDIPFEARVMALADVFDALVSKRVYKESFGYDKAFGIIKDSCGEHFDPELCEEFLSLRPQLEALYNSYSD